MNEKIKYVLVELPDLDSCFWTTKEGTKIAYKDLTDEHLQNIQWFYARKFLKYKLIKQEMKRRKLKALELKVVKKRKKQNNYDHCNVSDLFEL